MRAFECLRGADGLPESPTVNNNQTCRRADVPRRTKKQEKRRSVAGRDLARGAEQPGSRSTAGGQARGSGRRAAGCRGHVLWAALSRVPLLVEVGPGSQSTQHSGEEDPLSHCWGGGGHMPLSEPITAGQQESPEAIGAFPPRAGSKLLSIMKEPRSMNLWVDSIRAVCTVRRSMCARARQQKAAERPSFREPREAQAAA